MPSPLPTLFPIYLPGGGVVEATDAVDHAASALLRLAEQFRGKPNLAALLNDLNAQTQELETALQDLFTQRSIDTAFGAQLDVLGKILGQARGGFDDDTYRQYLRARMLLNISSASTEDIYGIFRALIDDTATVEIEDQYPAAFVLRVGGQAFPPEEIAQLIVFLRLARGAAIGGRLEWFESAPEDVFRFDIGPGLDLGYFAGALL